MPARTGSATAHQRAAGGRWHARLAPGGRGRQPGDYPVNTYVCLGTNDLRRAAAFYDAVLAPLGLARCATPGEDVEGWIG